MALYTARHVPTPLREQVKKELERMESIGVISPVSEPTDWCAGMVVVPKKNGTARIWWWYQRKTAQPGYVLTSNH